MKSTSQEGNIHNVENFELMINFCTQYGAKYNPTKPSIKLPQLITLRNSAFSAMQNVQLAIANHEEVVNKRSNTFADLDKLGTRILNALKAVDTTKEKIDDAKGSIRKMRGGKASKKSPSQTIDALTGETEVENTHSTSQQGIIDQIQHFGALIFTVTNEPLYIPNEADLKVPALNARLAAMKTANSNFLISFATTDNVREARNTIIYAPKIGLVDTALSVKSYVKSVFGAQSMEYKQISALKFTRYKS